MSLQQLNALKKLLPQGEIYNGFENGNGAIILNALAEQLAQLETEAEQIKKNFIIYENEQVEQWEKVRDLPAVETLTAEQRQARIKSIFIRRNLENLENHNQIYSDYGFPLRVSTGIFLDPNITQEQLQAFLNDYTVIQNYPIFKTMPNWTTVMGTDANFGNANYSLGSRIGYIEREEKDNFRVDFIDEWAAFYYLLESNETDNGGVSANIPETRRLDFINLTMKIKPTFMNCLARINWTT